MTPLRTAGSGVQCRAARATAAALAGVAATDRAVLPLYVLFGAHLGPAVAAAVHVGVVPGQNVVVATRRAAAAALGDDAREVAYGLALVGLDRKSVV